jgi:hypothetical protein
VHLLFEQLLPPLHLIAQVPQFSLSEVRSTQDPPQAVNPVAQVRTHRPCMHSSVGGQTVPHEPQLRRLPFRLTHRLLHALRPVPQSHLPSIHSMAPGQLVPHIPQLRVSDLRSTQLPEQANSGAVQPVAQLPWEQTWRASQLWSQAPQCGALLRRSKQVAPQAVSPGGQTHWPSAQILPPAQEALQAPQLTGSD